MDTKKLSDFLVKAKINTYASGKEFDFEEKEFRYRDRYFGFNPFIGEEVVWQKKEIIWGMNYYGRIVSGTRKNESAAGETFGCHH